MLAVAWPWADLADSRHKDLSNRLGASLCAGIGGQAGTAEFGGIHFSYRPLKSAGRLARLWRPAILPGGEAVVFHGYFDNADSVAEQIGADPRDPALLYGLAVESWGDEADQKIVGEYCAVIADPKDRRLRLSRSPLRAPPLCYHHDDRLTVVSSVPRAIFTTGVERRLNHDRLADSALLNFTDTEAGWFEDISRVPIGSIVELRQGRSRSLRSYYDLLDIPDAGAMSDADCIARAGELLDEGVKACMARFRQPAVALSGGLDSPQVAARALEALPTGQRLPSFTFHPEAGFDGIVEPWMFADDRPFVEAFAAMHPRLEPHFTANEGYEHDYRWNEFFHLMGGAPSGLCNMYVFHGLFSGAAKAGCDVLLLSEWGNETFSIGGEWACAEYLLGGHMGQLWSAVKKVPGNQRSLASRIATKAIMPFLPNWLWRLAKKARFPRRRPLLDSIQPLAPAYRRASGAEGRLRDINVVFERFEPRSRRHAHVLLQQRGDFQNDEVLQAFEQMYGVAQRDPTAYRPFVEFCFGLPTKMFIRDGETRWLARQMAKGRMPEEQRVNRRSGRWDADWHLRIGRRRGEFIAELDRLAKDERMASMIDVPRLRAALEDWPEKTQVDRYKAFAREMAVPRGLLTARFIQYVERSNAS